MEFPVGNIQGSFIVCGDRATVLGLNKPVRLRLKQKYVMWLYVYDVDAWFDAFILFGLA